MSTNSGNVDLFAALRSMTPARIGIGRSGDSTPTGSLLAFQAAHALARDAVHGTVDWDAVRAELDDLDTITVRSNVFDRSMYLRHPNLGRELSEESKLKLQPGAWDLAIVVADGLSSAAIMSWASRTVKEIIAQSHDLTIAPIVFAQQARVAIGDGIGQSLGAKLVVVLIGERPGLSVSNSLGIYLTYDPRLGRRDSERNCISNIHATGLSPEQAAHKVTWLACEALRLQQSGIKLKDRCDGEPETVRLINQF